MTRCVQFFCILLRLSILGTYHQLSLQAETILLNWLIALVGKIWEQARFLKVHFSPFYVFFAREFFLKEFSFSESISQGHWLKLYSNSSKNFWVCVFIKRTMPWLWLAICYAKILHKRPGFFIISKHMCSWIILCFEYIGVQIVVLFMNSSEQLNYWGLPKSALSHIVLFVQSVPWEYVLSCR